ncbi:carbohydrate ABC transporter permease [Fodinicurvata sp. EGI_FJ10296]|uniref:carbohydrate ABC transporter permease n=1 Tax=Fodinicurvata sp. EGI_FJ10296 TaxID=3231908 RepID=UPI00345230DB
MTKKSSSRVRIYAVMGLVGCYFAFPIVFMFMSALKDRNSILADARSIWAFLPVGDIGLENFRYVLFETSFIYYLANSLLISLITVGAGVIVNSMLAFSLQRMRWRGREMVLVGVIALLIIPFEAIAIPLLVLVSKLPSIGLSGGWPVLDWGWFNTHHVQIIPFIGHAFSVYLFYQFFRDIPRELDEAATVDGATPWDIYWRIVMPNAKPIISTVAIILLMAMWNQYLWPVMVVQGEGARPVMPGIQIFFGRTVEWGQIMAYAALITLPILALFLLFQRQFVQSVVGSGIKG